MLLHRFGNFVVSLPEIVAVVWSEEDDGGATVQLKNGREVWISERDANNLFAFLDEVSNGGAVRRIKAGDLLDVCDVSEL